MKTIEEAAIECANMYVSGYRDFYPSNEGDFIDVFESGVEFAQRWIPIEEELPPVSQQVIVKLKNDWHTCTWLLGDGTFAYNVKPTHWRPINLK